MAQDIFDELLALRDFALDFDDQTVADLSVDSDALDHRAENGPQKVLLSLMDLFELHLLGGFEFDETYFIGVDTIKTIVMPERFLSHRLVPYLSFILPIYVI